MRTISKLFIISNPFDLSTKNNHEPKRERHSARYNFDERQLLSILLSYGHTSMRSKIGRISTNTTSLRSKFFKISMALSNSFLLKKYDAFEISISDPIPPQRKIPYELL